jgi:hypothetical protein
MCLAFLRVNYNDLRDRLAGGNDEEILEWCYEGAGWTRAT